MPFCENIEYIFIPIHSKAKVYEMAKELKSVTCKIFNRCTYVLCKSVGSILPKVITDSLGGAKIKCHFSSLS